MKLSMVFSAVDKASRTMRKIMDAERKLSAASTSGARKSQQANESTGRSLTRTERVMKRLGRASRKSFDAVVDGSRKAGRAVASLHRQTKALARTGFSQIGKGARKAATGVTIATGVMVGAYGSAALAASSLVGTAAEFEKFQTILETTEGSSQKAALAMEWVQEFAVNTPYELDQVTDSFVKLRSYGLDPTKGLLQSLGDTSAAMGKPLVQAVEAIADAVTGENERLKEFGITASKTGDKISYAYTNSAGVQMEAIVAAGDRAAIQQQLMEIMNEKYAGSMGRLSKTWSGMMANLMDLWVTFQMMVMDAGLFDWMKGKLAGVLDTVNQMKADGSLKEWATQIGQSIQNALENAWTFGERVYEIISTVTGYLSSAADYVGGWENLAIILGGIAFGPTLISTASGLVQIASGLAALSTALLANPIVLAVGVIAGAVYLIYRNWDKIGPYFRRIWEGIKSAINTVWEWMKIAFSWTPHAMIYRNWDGITAYFKQLWEGVKSAASTVWEWMKTAFSWTPLGMIVGNWDGIADALSLPFEIAKAAISTAWSAIKGIFTGNWVPDFTAWADVIDALPGVNWSELVSLEGLKDAWASVTGWFGSAAEGIWNMIPEMPNWVKDAFSLFQSDPQVNIDEVTRQSIVPSGSLDRSTLSDKQLAVLERMDKFREKVHGKPITMIEDPASLLQAADAAQRLERELPALSKAAEVALKDTGAALMSIRDLLAGTDFTDQGVALMRTLAAGIQQGTALVVAATVAATQTVRDHLPSSPAKTGPLSDIHRLKFGETIASSIRGEPMVRAMRLATAATLAAATPASAAQSVLPTAQQARAATTAAVNAKGGGTGSDTAQQRIINVTYGDITIGQGTAETLAQFKQEMAKHRREMKQMLDREAARERRKDF